MKIEIIKASSAIPWFTTVYYDTDENVFSNEYDTWSTFTNFLQWFNQYDFSDENLFWDYEALKKILKA